MSAKTLPARVQIESSETENDRFKRSFESWLWSSMIAATVLHFMLFQFWRLGGAMAGWDYDSAPA